MSPIVTAERDTTDFVEPTGSVSNALPIRRMFARSDAPIGTSVTAALAAAWVAVWSVVAAVAPVADEDIVLSTLDVAMQWVFVVALMGAAFGLLLRVRLGAMATVLGGLCFMAGSVTCWIDGHVGSWITVQFIGGAALAGAAAVTLLRE